MRRLATIVVCFALIASVPAENKQTVPALRWTENTANCTFQDSNDGRTYYGLSSGDFEITLAVDRQELEKIPHRASPTISVFLNFHYKGNAKLEVLQNKMYFLILSE